MSEKGKNDTKTKACARSEEGGKAGIRRRKRERADARKKESGRTEGNPGRGRIRPHATCMRGLNKDRQGVKQGEKGGNSAHRDQKHGERVEVERPVHAGRRSAVQKE